MSLQEIKVPDIGDFKDVEVIEILIAPGDTVEVDQSLITVESDKASMEIPSSAAGIVDTLNVKLGDRLNQGDLMLLLKASDAAKSEPAEEPKASSAPDQGASSKTQPEAPSQTSSRTAVPAPVDSSAKGPVVVLGGGPGGYSAAFRAADLGLEVILIERYPTLGGVCLNVGCIPSKALLHSVSVLEATQGLSPHGISFGKPTIDLDQLRGFKTGVVSKLTSGLAGMAKARKVTVIQGVGRFTGPHEIEVQSDNGSQCIEFSHAIIAAGSESVKLPMLPQDPRIVDSTGALALPEIPKRMLIIGGGIIGLEMGTVYSALGTRLDVVEMQDSLMPGTDKDLVKVWHKKNDHRFDRMMLNTRTVSAQAESDGIHVTFEGENAPDKPQVYDLVLQAVGRRPNGENIGAEYAGVQVSERGFIEVDQQMRTNVAHIYAIGDIVGQPMLAHKAVHEGHVAAEVIAGEKSYFDARVIPSVAYTDPEVAWVGVTEAQAKRDGLKITKGLFPWMASGRAIANDRDEGFTKLLFDAQTGRIVGGGIVGTGAGDLISEVVLAVEMGADAIDIGQTIHPHPTLGESVGMAAEAALGICTDLPPSRKR